MNTTNLTPGLKRTLFAGAVLVAAVSASFAQTAPSAPTPAPGNKEQIVKLSPFVVSQEGDEGYRAAQTMLGSRSAKDILDIPASITIINMEMLSDFKAETVHDVFRYVVSGATQNQTFNEDLNIRGFRSINSTLRDGVPRVGGSNKFPPLYDVERVEVLKGPGAMLTGTNTPIGGAINYISRAPTDRFAGEVQFSLSDSGGYKATANVSGPAYKASDWRLNYRVTIGGLRENEPSSKPTESQEHQFVGAGLAFYFGDRTSLNATIYHFVDDSYRYPQDFLDITAPVNPATGLQTARLNANSREGYAPSRKQNSTWPLTTEGASVALHSRLTDSTNLRLQYGYYMGEDRRKTIAGNLMQANNYMLTRQDGLFLANTESHNLQADLLHTLRTDAFVLNSTFGVDGITGKFRQKQINITNAPVLDTRTAAYPNDDAFFALFSDDNAYFNNRPAAYPATALRQSTVTKQSSSYVFENLSFWKDRINLAGGLRWYQPEQRVTNDATGVITNSNLKNFSVHNYGIVVKVLPQLSLYYVDAKNLFAPDLAIFTDKFAQGDRLGELFRQSEGKLTEYGVKFQHNFKADFTVYGTVTHFEMAQTNIRTIGVLPNGALGNIQAADRSSGWETDIGVQAKAGPGRFDVIFTYFNGESFATSAVGTKTGLAKEANNFAPEKHSLLVKYGWKSGMLKGLMIGGGLEKEATQRSATYSVSRPHHYDAFARYAWNPQWEAQLNFDNLTDARYIVRVYNSGLVAASDPFRSRASLRYRW